MEVALSAPPGPSRRGTPLPLSQLVDSRSRSNVPNHLLESKMYVKLKSNRLIQAEPAELHFSGFELEKNGTKMLKITNISSEVLNIHIIPTQTKHFETSYTKKHRLIPGLSYTLKVKFRPDEWRYYYDSVRVHCKGEENLLIPVHAYPVIDDLHIPTHIDLSAVPLGQSVCRAIPMRCSCPVDFEFQVFVLEPNEAFSISPLKGLIPANSEVEIIVTFRPLRYETSQVTIQLIVSQFNTKPYLCTIRGSSAPDADLPGLGKRAANGDAVPTGHESSSPAARLKTKDRATKPPSGVRTHAGEAKDGTKSSSKDTRKGMLSLKNKKMKGNFQQNVKELRAKQPRGEVCLGDDLLPDETARQGAKERETEPEKCTACERAPTINEYDSSQKELEQRALVLFQQTAQKVVIRCRMNHRLPSPVTSLFRSNFMIPGEEDGTCYADMSSGRVFPSSFNIFCDENDLLALRDLDTLPVGTADATVTTCIPFFNLQAPQRYKLLGYRPLSAWEAFNSYIPSTFKRQLRSGDLDNVLPDDFGVQHPSGEQQLENEEEDTIAWDDLDFSAPESFLQHPPGNLLRIFNPAPGLQNYKTSKYLESDLDFHLCPVPRYKIPESGAKTSHTEKDFLDHEVWSRAVKRMDFSPLNCPFKRSELSCECFPHRSVCYSTEQLPPPPPLLTGPRGGSCPRLHKLPKVELTPEMVRAEFLSEKATISGSNCTKTTVYSTARPGILDFRDQVKWDAPSVQKAADEKRSRPRDQEL